jgi:hypothetical protein
MLVLTLGFGLLARADADGDGVEDGLDNCVYAANPGQEDSGALLSLVPDGIGDACQCGDVSGDGLPTVVDVVRYRRALLLLDPPLPAPQKCDVALAVGSCDGLDVTRLRGALAADGFGLAQICEADRPPGPDCSAAAFPDGDRLAVDPATSHCFVSFDDDVLTFAEAEGACVARRGHLATITNASEDAIVRSVQNPTQNPWIGATDAAVEGSFQWLTGEKFEYQSFAPGEPDDDAGFGGNGDCLQLANALGQWSDTNCTFLGVATGSICEIEIAP